ncbi:uncharacterized protein LY89DRAFT_699490 [Mollisia scopiformis]|uniref:Hexosyltransferase n=1 Tax=Mollisia scopiformis TaxID=149040 RepID=A0A194WY58_MOLSC|nr:uncharacterized protein LY89DRAFT_699490 [Mollisia scopiformis]KUJ12913.1 hypothetical protein LY89DRAFT_699490 [Mollisia scopiformis]
MLIGLVFFGRREMVKVLDCYLKRNLKDNGGLLDQVIFTVHTDNEEDLAYLEDLLKTSPRYSKHIQTQTYSDGWYTANWEPVKDPKAVYIKIDDDVVFIENKTISAVVTRLLDNPQYFAVSANVLNNPSLSWVHYHISDFNKDGSTPAPYAGHRWLPARVPPGSPYNIEDSPVSTFTYDAFGPSLGNWAAAAQSHYSFLHHLEKGDTWRYEFDTWDYSYTRLSINFFAIRGKDIMDAFPFPFSDDEAFLTEIRLAELKGMWHGLTDTDLMSRYKAYADEMVCVNIPVM